MSLRSIAALVLAGAACATLPVEIRQAIEDAASGSTFGVSNKIKAAQDYASERRRLFETHAKTDGISNYGKSKETEFVAESIAAYTSPLYDPEDGLPREVEDFIKKILYTEAPNK